MLSTSHRDLDPRHNGDVMVIAGINKANTAPAAATTAAHRTPAAQGSVAFAWFPRAFSQSVALRAAAIRAYGAALHQAGRLRSIAASCTLAVMLLAVPALAAEGAIGRDADPRPLEEKAQAAEKKGEVLEEKASAGGDKKAPAAAQTITKPEAQAVDPRGDEALDEALTCLARSIYWEAKGEDRPGMEAIASVVMNRLGNGSFPNTVCGVVKEGKERGACQFSWWCDGSPDDVEEESRYTITMEIARQALNRQLSDRTGGALYFHSGKVTPSWDDDYVETAEFGNHRFYKPKDGKAK